MREVVSKRVWIGNARDAQDITSVLATEIEAVVQLAFEEPPTQFPREIICCRFPLYDGEGNLPAILRITIQTISMLIDAQVPTLVTCSGGMSRSPAITAAAIAHASKDAIDDCLRKIAAFGPCDIAPALWNDIRTCFDSY